jgi:hypothetical protein
MTNIFVSSLSIYPLKSCREIKENATWVEDFGLKDDRRWMVVDDNGVMLTQRKIAKMCLIQPEITATGLILKTVTMNSIYVDTPFSNNKCSVKVWTDQCQAYDAGDEAANWLSQFLSTKCRLVYFPVDEVRQVDLNYAKAGDKTAFSDGFPLLLISQESLDDLNQRLSNPVAMNRFRPNIVVKGCLPFAEDSWKKIRIGEITFRIVKPCSRCVIPSINIETAEKEEEPLKALVSYRKHDNKIFFGQNVIADTKGKIEVGMQLEIIE